MLCTLQLYYISRYNKIKHLYDRLKHIFNNCIAQIFNEICADFSIKFQLKVWNYLKTIPKGTVKTYKQVAIALNSPKSARAVANACGKNPYAPKIPCHRVIRSDGGLGGYSGRGGIKTKLRLLRAEKVDI